LPPKWQPSSRRNPQPQLKPKPLPQRVPKSEPQQQRRPRHGADRAAAATQTADGAARQPVPKRMADMMQTTPPPRRAGIRRATLGALLLALLWTLVNAAHPATAEAAEPNGVLEIVTVPQLAGARFMVDGRTHRADQQGVVRINVSAVSKHKISVVDKQISQPNRELSFVRWYQQSHERDFLHELDGLVVRRHLRVKAAYRATYTLQYSFVDRAQKPVERERVSRVEFRSDHGQTVSGNGSGKLTVVGIRPVIAGGTLLAKKVSYSVQRVDVDGSNAVQVNAQRFVPSDKPTLVIPLPLHTVHFRTRDFLFDQPAGQAVWLKYPDGHAVKVPLDADGKATVERLAKGSYTVRVDAPGLSFERPLVISRTQYVELQHLSRLDISVAAGVFAALILSLFLVRMRGRSDIFRSARLRSARTWALSRRS
jgi:hypothetical protein